MQPDASASDRAHVPVGAPDSITVLLSRASAGDADALSQLVPLVYGDLHRIAEGYLRSESPGHTLQATALIHEAYLRLAKHHGLDYRNRSHFFALAARIMRQILVDHARGRRAAKRGAGIKIPLHENVDVASERDEIVVQLDSALSRLAQDDEVRARLVEMRFFGGMTAEDIAACVAMPVHTVRRELRGAQAWLRREILR